MAKDEQEVPIFPMGAVLNRIRPIIGTGRKGRKARQAFLKSSPGSQGGVMLRSG